MMIKYICDPCVLSCQSEYWVILQHMQGLRMSNSNLCCHLVQLSIN